MYRYRRLGEARAAAREAGFRGAMFPWQSGSEGKEETQQVHLNPLSGRWEPDLSRNQRHVNAAIFYNIWHYFQATADLAFLREYGAEMMLEIARFWASIAHFNAASRALRDPRGDGPGRVSREVPGGGRGRTAQQRLHKRDGGLAMQNSPRRAVAPARLVARTRCAVSSGSGRRGYATWEDISRRMFVPFHDDGIISQFEGYEDLEELDWDVTETNTGTSSGSTGSCAPRATTRIATR